MGEIVNDNLLDDIRFFYYFYNKEIQFICFIFISLFVLYLFYNKFVEHRLDPYRSVDLKCFFCHVYNPIPYIYKNQWSCTHCGQYNGFTKDGDYNTVLPLMHEIPKSPIKLAMENKKPNNNNNSNNNNNNNNNKNKNNPLLLDDLSPSPFKISPLNLSPVSKSKNMVDENQRYQHQQNQHYSSQLCTNCQYHLQNKLDLSKSYNAINDEDLENYSKKLESEFKLCQDCSQITKNEINKIDTYIISTYSKNLGVNQIPIPTITRKDPILTRFSKLIKKNSYKFSILFNSLIYIFSVTMFLNSILLVGKYQFKVNLINSEEWILASLLGFKVFFKYFKRNVELEAIKTILKNPRTNILTKEFIFYTSLIVFKFMTIKYPTINNQQDSVLINIWNQISNNIVFSSMFYIILLFVHKSETAYKLPKPIFTNKIQDIDNSNGYHNNSNNNNNNNNNIESLVNLFDGSNSRKISTPAKNPFNNSVFEDPTNNEYNAKLSKSNNFFAEGLISSLNINEKQEPKQESQGNNVDNFIKSVLNNIFQFLLGIIRDTLSFLKKYGQFIMGFGLCFILIVYNHQIQHFLNNYL
ncbi:hypothetical protein DICPUDRAFT_84468 [Dictyostelium purpureum]|uniref:Ima1 N-terminal domain-containing protein n=1 Tax=Dictyostelium purpureum TaxID=5786 RepID=F1A2R4_DICPU|nr:uncharacterized protein DICPUDRAFT_84468 [Dictyostelium purpureum]EGC29518.1 hypothetical protein DICPUDRAFT_84468 [Dictyostelium purpureum]|eukprot:XP_003293962.1 hypothetical protein DICPUDRAFT_84468 [Dictyostelium purpureum]